jgi:tetratricopeptide (TPR) repeat protein
MGRFEEAIAAADLALPLLNDPEQKEGALKTRAQSNIRLARYAAAIDDYRKLLELVPSNRITSIELAIALGMDKRSNEALGLADKLLSERDGADIRFARAMIFSRMGKSAQAITEARQALQFKPGDPALEGLIRKLQAGS